MTYLDSHAAEKQAFFRGILGDERYDALEGRARARRDRKLLNDGFASSEAARVGFTEQKGE